MRKLLLLFFAATTALSTQAQTVSTFDTLTLSGTDTAYINYSQPGIDVGFQDADAYFPCFYNTSSFGDYWEGGFAYSNETDSVTSGYLNEYAAKAGSVVNGSSQYCVFWQGYGAYNVHITGASAGMPVHGFYITNSTFAYNSMRDGDFVGKKFGGVDGTDPDFFKLTVRGFSNGVLGTDSVEFYLADFRSANNADDSIVRGWNWVNLLPLGGVDSLQFVLSSSDVGQFGINTPLYFCLDNFTTSGGSTSVNPTSSIADLKVYPNPATDNIYITSRNGDKVSATIYDATGKVVLQQAVVNSGAALSIDMLTAGTYFLQIKDGSKTASIRFVKQ